MRCPYARDDMKRIIYVHNLKRNTLYSINVAFYTIYFYHIHIKRGVLMYTPTVTSALLTNNILQSYCTMSILHFLITLHPFASYT